jgi:hypothetical protein
MVLKIKSRILTCFSWVAQERQYTAKLKYKPANKTLLMINIQIN